MFDDSIVAEKNMPRDEPIADQERQVFAEDTVPVRGVAKLDDEKAFPIGPRAQDFLDRLLQLLLCVDQRREAAIVPVLPPQEDGKAFRKLAIRRRYAAN